LDGINVKEETVFVYSAGKLVAEYSTKPPPLNPTTSYTITDQLLSPRVITDSNGQVISRRDFMPFGEEAISNIGERPTTLKYGTADSVRQRFTGYEKDDETGLDFAEARMYENRHGRFTAVDPLLASGKSADPQSFNRYIYVMNNPIVATDPSGMQTNSNPNFRPPSTAGTSPCNFDNPGCSLYRRDAPVGEVTVNGGGTESLLAAQEDYATTMSNAVLNQPTSTAQVNYPIRAMLMGFPANPWEQAGEGSVTGLKNVPIVLWNSATSGRLKYDSGGLSFGPNPVEIQPYGCNNRIGCSWSGGTTVAALIAPGVVGAVFSGGAASLSVVPDSPIAMNGAKVEYLTEGQISKIQNWVDKRNVEVRLFGSRAKGTANASSDFDYFIESNYNLRNNAKFELPRGPAYSGRNRIDVIKPSTYPKFFNQVIVEEQQPNILFFPKRGVN
jgi:RHS repeat-associated protein